MVEPVSSTTEFAFSAMFADRNSANWTDHGGMGRLGVCTACLKCC
jgi:hypothetical protein